MSAETLVAGGKQMAMAAIYGGGPFYPIGPHGQPNDLAAVGADLKLSGFTTVTELIHLGEDGTIQIAPWKLVENGAYVGDSTWPGWLAQLKQEPTSIDRLIFCLGGAGVGDFDWIKNLVEAGGAEPGGILYNNFLELKSAIPALDGIDLDDETTFDPSSTVTFCQMLNSLGYEVTFCPFGSQYYWMNCLSALNKPGSSPIVSGINLQCYAGGAGQDPLDWAAAVSTALNIPLDQAKGFVFPGLWCVHPDNGALVGDCPKAISDRFRTWESGGIQGGFIWLYDDIQQNVDSGFCGGPMGSVAYASAIVDRASGTRSRSPKSSAGRRPRRRRP